MASNAVIKVDYYYYNCIVKSLKPKRRVANNVKAIMCLIDKIAIRKQREKYGTFRDMPHVLLMCDLWMHFSDIFGNLFMPVCN